jgi:hypothetical protein
MAHAVIDLDDLCKVYPTPDRSFARENLNAIWPNYAAIPHLKLVIPRRHCGRGRTAAVALRHDRRKVRHLRADRTRGRPEGPGNAKSIDETAQEVIEQAGWQRQHEAMQEHQS